MHEENPPNGRLPSQPSGSRKGRTNDHHAAYSTAFLNGCKSDLFP